MKQRQQRKSTWAWALLSKLSLVCLILSSSAAAQAPDDELVQLDFNDVELSVVIDTIARKTGKNFVYDDRVRGRVTIISPTKISVEQAYAVFESVLQVKGFTTVEGPGGAIKVIPIREVKQSSIKTEIGTARPALRDRFVTRLIPLRYIDAEQISNTLKPLVSKEASLVPFAPTNTIIMTDSHANIRRVLTILQAIDVATHKEEMAVIKIQHADATTMANQLSEIFGATVSGSSPTSTARSRTRRAGSSSSAAAAAAAQAAQHGQVRILTDERTNSLLVLASRTRLEEIRDLVARLDVPVVGGGRIHVHYLKHADAEELAQTLGSLIGGQRTPAAGGGARGAAASQAQALRSVVSELSEGITMTADPATNSLIIQASQEAFNTLVQVIDKLDKARPQVLIEALIMDVIVSDQENLGFNGLLRLVRGDTDISLQSATDAATGLGAAGPIGAGGSGTIPFIANLFRSSIQTDANGVPTSNGSLIQSIIKASASDGNTNVLSAPHILTSDNEEAEIRIGDNIPIITSRVESAAGQDTNLASSVNVERRDIGVTLRVTPQISDGDTLRLDIFQEISDVNSTLTDQTGGATETGVALSTRRIENTVVVHNNETVVIGGLIKDDYEESESKIPWLGDIPLLGWLFKTTSRDLTKTNLLVFLTPHVMRSAEDLEKESIRKREEFRRHSLKQVDPKEKQQWKDQAQVYTDAGSDINLPEKLTRNKPVYNAVDRIEERYPLDRMLEIDKQQRNEEQEVRDLNSLGGDGAPMYGVLADVFYNESEAIEALNRVLDAGYDATLHSGRAGNAVFYEVKIAPYPTLEEAMHAAEILKESFQLAPSVTVQSGNSP